MTRVWGDANLFIRLLTNQPTEMAERAEAFLKRAEREEFRIVLAPLVVAECAWVLISFYKHDKAGVADALLKVLTLPGLEVLEQPQLTRALETMADKNVDFIDAYLAAWALWTDDAIASFDEDFSKLRVKRIPIG